ncbi:MAG TPA: WcaF family extracellular polysaccharide biosynthesis acetyltransferase [Planctomycetota bacterium]|nr:WcaF family extracellular polysaccharide biosynthesis acetyltransferase [Planctomycetota bacterium]
MYSLVLNRTIPGMTMSQAGQSPARDDHPNVELSRFDNRSFDRGASRLKEMLWLLVSLLVFRIPPICASGLKVKLLKAFGAHVGSDVVIKPGVKIAFPWKLTLGSHVWLGEECWLLNLAPITIGSNVCISQRALLCTGNHNYRDPAFGLITQPIHVHDGAWIGAASFVAPGVTVHRNAVLGACSMATRDLLSNTVYRGVPARPARHRWSSGSENDQNRRSISCGFCC